jgi:hypothetical protein
MVVNQAAGPGEVQVGQSGVVVAAGSDQHVIDRARQLREELVEAGGIGSVEGGGAPSVDLGGGTFEMVGITADEDDVGALAAGASSGFQPDTGAAADNDDGLAEQLPLAGV